MDGWTDRQTEVPEKLVSIGRCHLSQARQDPLIMAVTLLGNVLQNLPELHKQAPAQHHSLDLELCVCCVSTMFSLMSSFCVIWMRVWNSLP